MQVDMHEGPGARGMMVATRQWGVAAGAPATPGKILAMAWGPLGEQCGEGAKPHAWASQSIVCREGKGESTTVAVPALDATS